MKQPFVLTILRIEEGQATILEQIPGQDKTRVPLKIGYFTDRPVEIFGKLYILVATNHTPQMGQ